jgi:hypothetical protein
MPPFSHFIVIRRSPDLGSLTFPGSLFPVGISLNWWLYIREDHQNRKKPTFQHDL